MAQSTEHLDTHEHWIVNDLACILNAAAGGVLMLTNKIYLNWNRSVPFFTIARIKSIFKAVVLLLFALSSRGEQKPNILLIISDDQGWTDYGFMGHPEIQTPHLDRLASESLLFKRGYVASPLCRPSLASIATGLFPFDHGATGNES